MKRKNENSDINSKKLKTNKDANINQIIKYKPLSYYKMGIDYSLSSTSNRETLTPNIMGSKLVAQYYKIKYHCKIIFTRSCNVEDESIPLFHLFQEIDFATIRKHQNNQRIAFLYGMDEIHAIPLIYIKEGNNECILIADTHGESYTSMVIAEAIHQKLGILVFLIEKPRQADKYSCYTDALVFARDCTALDIENNKYYIPNLWEDLIKRQFRPKEGVTYLLTKLPDNLLKTSQISTFLQEHQELESKIIHKNENLRDFRERYTEKFFTSTATYEAGINSYSRKKGLNLALIIEIMFYLEQIETALVHPLSREEKLDFIAKAKNIFYSSNDEDKIYEMTKDYIHNFKLSSNNPK